jgi:hypothetical protein
LTGVPPGSGSVQLTGGFTAFGGRPRFAAGLVAGLRVRGLVVFTGRGLRLWLQCPLQPLNLFAHTGIAVELHAR